MTTTLELLTEPTGPPGGVVKQRDDIISWVTAAHETVSCQLTLWQTSVKCDSFHWPGAKQEVRRLDRFYQPTAQKTRVGSV